MVDDRDLNGKELTVPTGGALARPDATQYGVNLGEEDLVMPRVTLLQPTSKIDGAGKFYFSLTGEKFDSMEIVVFGNQRGRVMFDPDRAKQEAICGSDDRVVPSTRYEKPQAERCIACNFSKRGYTEKVIISGKEVQQYCSETQGLKCMFVDTLFPFVYIARRTSLKPINDWLTLMQYETVRNNLPLCCFPIRITSFVPPKAAEKYYVPNIERLGKIEKEEFKAMMNKYQNYNIGATLDEEAKDGTTPF